MSLPINSALYYPTIEFQDYRWLWTASLVWDKIYRIEPEDFRAAEPDNVRILCEEGDIGIPLRPGRYAQDVAGEFMDGVNSRKWDAAAFDASSLRDEYARLHHEKIDVQIRKMLISTGRAASHEQWLYVPDDFAALYMTYLATRMAEKNDLQAISDTNVAWTAHTYFSNEGIDTECVPDEYEQTLAALLIGNYVPENITDISPKQILAFRKRYPDERRNFMRAVKGAAAQLANCSDPTVIQDVVQTVQGDVGRATKDFQRSMEVLGAKTFTGFKTMSFPMATAALATFAPITFGQSVVIGATGFAIGALASFATRSLEADRLSKSHEYSYLVHANKAFPKAADRIDLPRRLYRDLHEFIND
ncbi:DUF6236 family protein [Actomonas aquatica]|uniref:DUF6236 family protein n=1 Tax=Actomonas aquatica TaxID=2866162 RepID=A0ABZ1C8N3_9BACT|nr:DUF6236 family protein [Opitutus sp. WL0086]WRQ88064.1 DUF6236 family protein [Opitutus sp. WL0086]